MRKRKSYLCFEVPPDITPVDIQGFNEPWKGSTRTTIILLGQSKSLHGTKPTTWMYRCDTLIRLETIVLHVSRGDEMRSGLYEKISDTQCV